VGGDTLWASAYEAYDRLSPAYQKFLEGLTATHIGQHFVDLAAKNDKVVMRENRGSPENVGQDLTAVHPIIRTNPVTGWKGLFVSREFTKRVNGLTKGESDSLLAFLNDHISSVCLPLPCFPVPTRSDTDMIEPRSASPIPMGRKLISDLG
jgi:alpha-ketoglutarate-dependent taurine dioxygenase